MVNGDALDRELASLAETTNLSNPLTFGHKNDWQTMQQVSEKSAKHEGEYAKTLPKTFILTEPKHTKGAFAIAAKAARDPIQPMRPNRLNENGSTTKLAKDASETCGNHATANNAAAIVVSGDAKARIPHAKRSHMDGILRGIPGETGPTKTTQSDAFVFDGEMNDMNQYKNTSFHRKRDAYSEYVEARARFSKMHSVN
uniref:Uncharacterized protein n=1 Tax=Globisporangium ultimum (strain ATCC 200006 / CBS 805.95 / DAOM BR144) TaxID=431595 RepID=K3WGC7_GLOUD